MIAMRVCRRHPKERAGWNCSSCRADLCPDCVTKQPGGPHGTRIPVCCTCGRDVAPITVTRRAAQQFTRRLLRAFGFPLSSAGIIALCFVGLVRALTSYAGTGSLLMGSSVFVLRQGLYWAMVFFIVRGVATGARRMGVFDLTDIHSDIIAPAIKGIFATAIIWIPAAVYVYLAADNGLAGLFAYPSYRDPAVWLLGLLGALYVPMALIAAATDLGFGHILNPIFIGQAIYHVGKDYFVATVSIGFVLLVGAGASALLGAALTVIPVPFVGRWIALTAGLYPPFVAAGMLGTLLYVHGEVLDWGRSEEYQELVLPGVEPQGQLRPRPQEKPEPPPARAAVPAPAPDPGPTPSVVPLALGPDLATISPSVVPLVLGPDLVAISPSVLDLPMTPSLESQVPVPDGEAKPHSRLRFGIVVSPSLLEAQAFVEHEGPGPVDLPPAQAKAAAEPSPSPAEPEPATHPASPAEPAPATHLASPAGPVTAFVEPRPGPLRISAAPTVYGFSPALSPPTEAAPTRIGHAALQPTAPEEKKDR